MIQAKLLLKETFCGTPGNFIFKSFKSTFLPKKTLFCLGYLAAFFIILKALSNKPENTLEAVEEALGSHSTHTRLRWGLVYIKRKKKKKKKINK